MSEPSNDLGDETIRSVARTFKLLELLSGLESASIGELSRRLCFPKPTVVRMIRTLVQGGYVHQASPRSDYCVTSKLRRLGAGFSGLPAVMEAAVQVADRLTAELLWPISIAQPAGDATIVRYSTIPASPYAHARSTIGKRLPLWTSAHGKAWLAHLPLSERPAPPAHEPATGESAEMLLTDLRHAIEGGYAIRTLGRDPTTNSIAVPIFEQGHVVATLGITFFARVLGPAAVRRMAQLLLEAATEIGTLLDRQGCCSSCASQASVPQDGMRKSITSRGQEQPLYS
ncbi:helix-turn-helix domain-containing protein [Sphingomonas sp. CGMCC 1.13654]|uniref:Helix-turn-helix domain-containing protein n=1 Tax=Sphingomonas chungangi TaxID=2683589 RepID=A0A838L686_9SPHN|nr:IclR family transcriptional regulator C-terminal domain-containing protein [Sphingomonas chungangi]MBA2933969.1 helix-turn-helix domain-containing protein [Sphingomonas chungangi]